jgi:hypothetical protein
VDKQHLRRLQLLSKRFVELQGLRVAFAGAAIATVFGSYLASTHPTESGAWIAIALSGALMIPGEWWLHRYYANTFGRQVTEPRNWRSIGVFLLAYNFVGFFLDRRFPEIPAGGPTVFTFIGASVFIAIRDWPWRLYYLGAAASVAIAFGANVFGVDVIDRGMTMTVAFLACGFSMIVAGVLDHWLLVRLMASARAEQAHAFTPTEER